MSMQPKKFGYMYPMQAPAPIEQPPSPQDEIAYITAYMDVRARQIYDKLKSLIPSQVSCNCSCSNVTPTPSTSTSNADPLILQDRVNGKTYEVFMYDNSICTNEITSTSTNDPVTFTDRVTGEVHTMFMYDGSICTE